MDTPTPTPGVRCAWCGNVLREPVGYPDAQPYPNHENHLAWTHGMCLDCQKRFEDDALLPVHDRRSASHRKD
jgi:hypothetical protein